MVGPGKATIRYTLPMPPESPIGDRDAEEIALNAAVLSTDGDSAGFSRAVAHHRAELHDPGETRQEEELDLAVRQIISRAGLDKPDISVLSDDSSPRCPGCPNTTSRWSCYGSC